MPETEAVHEARERVAHWLTDRLRERPAGAATVVAERLRRWPGGSERLLARAGYHGRPPADP